MSDFYTNIMQINDLIGKVAGLRSEVENAANIMAETILNGGAIYICGNGGSASEANHFAGEILGRFKKERKGLAAISLTADNATITAIANDYGYDQIFKRQLEGLFNPEKDLLFSMSTSGNSENIIKALEYLDTVNGKSINLLGRDGGLIGRVGTGYPNEINIVIPAQDSDRIQEMHLFILHYFAEVIEEEWVNK